MTKQLLIVSHAPSPNTQLLRDALIEGAEQVNDIKVTCVAPLESGPEPVLTCDGIILSTTENLGYMSGALKDFFDRIYYPVLEETQGLPYALQIRAGLDGSGTATAVERIVSGPRWKAAQEPLICKGDFQDSFIEDCRSLGETFATALSMGVI